MKTLCQKLSEHFNVSETLLHKNLCGFIGVSQDDNIVTIYHDGSIRVGDTDYSPDFSLSSFMSDIETKYKTIYSELKDISDVLFALREKMEKVSKRVDGNGHSCFYPEMIKKVFEGYASSLSGMSSSVNAIANYTPSYGINE